jgi:Arc/MetJ family transcription regulator
VLFLTARQIRRYNTHQEVYMRTNIVLDDRLVADAMRLTGAKSKREVVELALRQIVITRRRRNVLDLAGQGLIAPDYDVRKVRARMDRRERHGSR